MSRKKSSNSTYTHLFKVCQRPVLAGLCHTFQRVCLWERKRGMDNSRVNMTEQLLLTDTGHKTTKCSQIYSKSCRKPSIWGKMVTVASILCSSWCKVKITSLQLYWRDGTSCFQNTFPHLLLCKRIGPKPPTGVQLG